MATLEVLAVPSPGGANTTGAKAATAPSDGAAGGTGAAGSLADSIVSRAQANHFYVNVGDVLVALNPCRRVECYGPDAQARYLSENRGSTMPAHVFGSARHTFFKLQATGKDQLCLITGESGSGKTETVRRYTEQIVRLADSAASGIAQLLPKVTVVLEAFGNAATALNANATRNCMNLELGIANGRISGVHVDASLLERSRVASASHCGFNFHIFYLMFHGCHSDDLSELCLSRVRDCKLLTRASAHPLEAFLPAKAKEVEAGLAALGVQDDTLTELYQTLAAILHLGNLKFEESPVNDAAKISNTDDLDKACVMIGVSVKAFSEALLRIVSFMARGERIERERKVPAVIEIRNATADVMYSRLYTWLVATVNHALEAEAMFKHAKISIFDSFGCEAFETNGFEQLVVNFVNEQLQKFFIKAVFDEQRRDYKQEGIDLSKFSFPSNSKVVKLFMARPSGMLDTLDQHYTAAASTPETLKGSFDAKLGPSPAYVLLKDSNKFGVHHYGGVVTYSAEQFMGRSDGQLPEAIVKALRTSKIPLVAKLFPSDPQPDKDVPLASSVALSVQTLVRKLRQVQSPTFIRCIKPNAAGRPGSVDKAYIEAQLETSGLQGYVRLAQKGYPVRLPAETFFDEHYFLAFPFNAKPPVNHAVVRGVMGLLGSEGWEVGKSKVFMKEHHLAELSQRRLATVSKIVTCQSAVRCFVCRRRLAKLLVTLRQQEGVVAQFIEYVEQVNEPQQARNTIGEFKRRFAAEKKQKLDLFAQIGAAAASRAAKRPTLVKEDIPADSGTGTLQRRSQQTPNPDMYAAFAKEQSEIEESSPGADALDPQPEPEPEPEPETEPETEPTTADDAPAPPLPPAPEEDEGTGESPPLPPPPACEPTLADSTGGEASPPPPPNEPAEAEQPARKQTLRVKPGTKAIVRGPPEGSDAGFTAFCEHLRTYKQPSKAEPEPFTDSFEGLGDASVLCSVVYRERLLTVAQFDLCAGTGSLDAVEGEDGPGHMGLADAANPFRDAKTDKIRAHIGSGIKIIATDSGSILVARKGKNPVFIRDVERLTTTVGHLKSSELPSRGTTLLFDVDDFKKSVRGCSLADAFRRSYVDLSLVRHYESREATPCWVRLYSMPALRILRDHYGNGS